MTFLPDERSDTIATGRERLFTALFLLVIVVFSFFDIFDDWYEGVPLYHISFEIVLGFLGIGLALHLFLRYARERSAIIIRAREEVVQAKKIASEWRDKARSFRDGLTAAISTQLEVWGLTDAEKEICFLLLKGFSLQEIADVRETSERTVRQQASVIYKKSALSGRVQLAAFFLEDFLVSSEKPTRS